MASGSGAVHFTAVVEKTLIPALASPLIAGIIAMIATYLAHTITRRTPKAARTNVLGRRNQPRPVR